jgi:hypothetical protein
VLGRAVVEFVALGFGLGLLGFALKQLVALGEKSRIAAARARMITGERVRVLIPCAS